MNVFDRAAPKHPLGPAIQALERPAPGTGDPDPVHMALADSLRRDGRVSLLRDCALYSEWRGVDPSDGANVAAAMRKVFAARVGQVPVADCEFCHTGLNAPNIIDPTRLREWRWFRSFMDVTRVVRASPAEQWLRIGPGKKWHGLPGGAELVATFTRRGATILPPDLLAFLDRVAADAPTEMRPFLEDFLDGCGRCLKGSNWHPGWVTPFDTDPPVLPPGGIDRELLRVGLPPSDGWWLEMWYTAADLDALIAANGAVAVPTVLDGGDHGFWHPAPPESFFPTGTPPTGFCVNLLEAVDEKDPLVPELIMPRDARLWAAAWRNSGGRIERARSETGLEICLEGALVPDVTGARLRHRARLTV